MHRALIGTCRLARSKTALPWTARDRKDGIGRIQGLRAVAQQLSKAYATGEIDVESNTYKALPAPYLI
jgi:hypothetical protein